MSERSKAFERPLPADWKPVVGELVYVAPHQPPGRLVAYATVVAIFDDLYRLEFKYGRKVWRRDVLLSSIRPLSKPWEPK